MKYVVTLCLLAGCFCAMGQTPAKLSITPTFSPAEFTPNTSITVTYDVTGTYMASFSAAYIWVWIPDNTGIGAPYDLTPADGAGNSASSHAKCTASVVNGRNLWSITFVPSAFFSSSIANETSMGILLKGNDWPLGQTTDFVAPFGFQVRLVSPTQQPLFESAGNHIAVEVTAPATADFTLAVNGKTLDSKTSLTDYTYQLVVSDSVPHFNVVVKATSGANTSTTSFDYYIHGVSPAAARPAGIIDGINYAADPTKVTLSLWAPNKTSVYLLGDFNDWKIDPAWIMNKDGEHFWLPVNGLTSGTEYGYQYLVDETVFVGDPYADKILDYSNDPGILPTTYPNLKTYPAGAIHNQDYFNRVAVFQTNQQPYVWTTTNYTMPAKEKLVIYELLVRDFLPDPRKNYKGIIDSVAYFKRLGVNAIELMPVMEFSGNDSWGYNPEFMFAPDKAYGTKNDLKKLVDTFHQNGIAVILDIVMNQQDTPNPYCLMYYDFNNNEPAANNPWFNVVATHPFSVFNDLNHESLYTKKYLDTITYHWLNEYKIDGYRFDLSKGFTQTVNTDVNAWGAYDQSRINILERMSGVIWSKFPNAYVILEHFAANDEETVLADYQADQGRGMMLWENYNYNYNQLTMGKASGTDFSSIYYANKGWSKPREISYMESHDEERLMYNNLVNGLSSGSYSVKTLNTALARMKGAAILFYTIPGPKMLWEFGDLGYDKSINTCTDGTVNTNCRVEDKPYLWDTYEKVAARADLQSHIADLLRLRRTYGLFTEGTASIPADNTLVKQITLKNQPFTVTPTDSTQMNAQVVANLDLTTLVIPVTFSHTGNWYDYYNQNKIFKVTGGTENVSIDPGQFKLYTDVPISVPKAAVVTGLEERTPVSLFPNPANETIFSKTESPVMSLTLRTMQGVRIAPPRSSSNSWDVHELAAGVYIAEVLMNGKVTRLKVIKK